MAIWSLNKGAPNDPSSCLLRHLLVPLSETLDELLQVSDLTHPDSHPLESLLHSQNGCYHSYHNPRAFLCCCCEIACQTKVQVPTINLLDPQCNRVNGCSCLLVGSLLCADSQEGLVATTIVPQPDKDSKVKKLHVLGLGRKG